MRRVTLVAAILVSVPLLPVHPAAASCAADSGPDGAPVVFVGIAEQERRGYTRFTVEEVWDGPDLASEVWVLSGEEQATWPLSLFVAVSSSVDADFAPGERYVVGATRAFVTNACRASSIDVDASQPGARQPVEDGSVGADPPLGPLGQIMWVAGILGLAVASIGLLRRFRRRGLGATATSA